MDKSEEGQFRRAHGRGNRIECLTGRCGAPAMRTAIHGHCIVAALGGGILRLSPSGKVKNVREPAAVYGEPPETASKGLNSRKKTATGSPSWDSAFWDGILAIKFNNNSQHGTARRRLEF